jgi:VCBS repeat-containing protein
MKPLRVTLIFTLFPLLVLFGCFGPTDSTNNGSSGPRIPTGDASQSFSTPPDPEKVINDGGAVYPINEVLIRLPDGASRAIAEEIATSINGTIVGFSHSANLYQIRVPSSSKDDLMNIINTLRSDSRIKNVSRNYFPDLLLTNDTTKLGASKGFDLINAYDKISIIDAWRFITDIQFSSFSPVKIAVIDSGVDRSHDEFIGVTLEGPDIALTDNNGHGTSIAGIIGANNLSAIASIPLSSPHMNGITAGIPGDTPSGSLIPYILEIRRTGSHAEIADRIDDLVSKKIQVINMSWGWNNKNTKPDDFLDILEIMASTIFKYANTVTFIAAAGNDGADAENQIPASILAPNLITVGATDLSDDRAVWIPLLSASNFGERVDISAPGTGVYAPIRFTPPLDDGDYTRSFSGTSAAAPMVTGVVALLLAIDPDLLPAEIREILQETADPIFTDERMGCFSLSLPEGATGCRLNALKAVQRVLSSPEPEPNNPPAPTAPNITTVENTPGISQVTVNDPDAGQTHTFAITIPPTNGTASVDANGVVTYAPNTGFVGLDSIQVTVTDNGTPPLSGTVTINVTVTLTDDIDGDGLSDAWEIAHWGDLTTVNDPDGDFDGDGLTNLEEFTLDTDPTLTDTDSDGFTDSAEVAEGTDPLDPDSKPPTTASPWSTYQHDAQHTGQSLVRGPQDATRQWEFILNPGGGFLGIPIVDKDGTIYVSAGRDNTPFLYAITPAGILKWQSVPLEAAPSNPTIGPDGTIYVGTQDFGRTVYALDPSNGTIQGTFSVDNRSDFVTIADDGTLYVGSENGNLYALTPDLVEKWRVFIGTSSLLPATIGSDGTVYITQSAHLRALRPEDGTQKWVVFVGSALTESATAASIALSGTIYAGGGDRFSAVTPDGTIQWQVFVNLSVCGSLHTIIGGLSIPALTPDGGIVLGNLGGFFTAGSGIIQAFNADGSTRWIFCPPSFAERMSTAPIVDSEGTVYFATQINQSGIPISVSTLYALNPDGSLKWATTLGLSVGGGLAIGPSGTLYVTASDADGAKLIAFGP